MKAHLRSLQEAFGIAMKMSQDYDMPEQYRKQFAGIANLLWDSLGKDKEVNPSDVPEPAVIARLRGLSAVLYAAVDRDELASLGEWLGKFRLAYQTVPFDDENGKRYTVYVVPENLRAASLVRDRWLMWRQDRKHRVEAK